MFDKNHFDLGMCNVQCASHNVYINRCACERMRVCVESVFEAVFCESAFAMRIEFVLLCDSSSLRLHVSNVVPNSMNNVREIV